MFQGGTLDIGITPTIRQPKGAYPRASTPKYYVDLKGAGHLAWTDLNPHFQAIISRYSIAFLDRYLCGKEKSDGLAPLVRRPWPDLVASLLYQE
jgi:hypothetical protein